jgi:vacuolar-type H+-ATPase subunit E/Vma4
MGIDALRDSVTDSVRKEADRIIEAARGAADREFTEKKAALDAEFARRFQAAARTIDDEYARKLIQVRGAHNKEILEKRNECLRDILRAAKSTVLSWPEHEYRAVMYDQIRRSVGGAGGKLRVHASDANVFESILGELNAVRLVDARIELDRSAPLAERGGFVFVSPAYEVDRTIDTALSDLEREWAPAIAASVFERK